MVGSSKILTVSYGTFSCTLEGFDDSFDTMKAIAEYFRDLAADDRYFGAEPPTPDAEMLARIAEREISRRVEAHEERGQIVLRADAGQALNDFVTRTAAAPAAAKDETPEAAGPAVQQEPAGPPDQAGPEPASEPAAPDMPETEMVKEAAPSEPETAAEAEVSAGAQEADHGPQDQAQDAAPATESATPLAPSEDAADFAAPEVADAGTPSDEPGQPEMIDAAAAHSAQEAELAEDAPVGAVPADSFAAKLDRIRSVVSGTESGFDSDYDDDDFAQDFLDPIDATQAEAERHEVPFDLAAAQESATSEDAPDRPDPEPAPRAEDDFEDTLAALMADAAPGAPAAPDDDAPEAAPMEDAAAPSPGEARVVKVKRAELDAAVEQGVIEEDAPAPRADADPEAEPVDAGAGLSPAQEAELLRELAEVEAELQDKTAAGAEQSDRPEASEADQAAEPAVEADAAEAPDTAEDSAEEALAEPETALEAETAPEPEETQEPEAADGPAEPAQSTARKLDDMSGANDLTRMFDETDSQFEAPASSQRRSAIQHLRAAVAATRAEQKAGSSLSKSVDSSPYRSDLDEVVRPRRPQVDADAARSSRPEEHRPAPLKLVAEQRIDTPRAPVRPRRVTSAPTEPEIAAQASGFGEFASERGAHSLPDLLEAAAAYMADVEGRPQFSRPMLMSKLKEVEQERFSREDGLRSFGQLLRAGKLQKLAGGRFAVTDETDFRAPGQREAG